MSSSPAPSHHTSTPDPNTFGETPSITIPCDVRPVPTWNTTISIPHYDLSALTFAQYTLNQTSLYKIFQLIEFDTPAVQDLLFINHINHTILDLERQIE